MKKILISILLLIVTFIFVGCEKDMGSNDPIVKNVIPTFENYDKAYIIEINEDRETYKYSLSDTQYASFKSILELIYNSKIVTFIPEHNYTALLTDKADPLPTINGSYKLIIYNSNDNTYITFYYESNDSKFSLIINDNSKVEWHEISDKDIVSKFGYEVYNCIENYFLKEMGIIDAYPFLKELNDSNTISIEIISSNSGVPPMSLNEHYYYEDEIKNYYLDWLKSHGLSLTSLSNIQVPGGVTSKLIIYLDNNEKFELEYYQGCLKVGNNYYSVCADEIYIAPSRIDYSFNLDSISGVLYENENTKGEHILDLSQIRFEYDVTEPVLSNNYILKTAYGDLKFTYENDLSSYFSFNDTIYHLTSGQEKIEEIILLSNNE